MNSPGVDVHTHMYTQVTRDLEEMGRRHVSEMAHVEVMRKGSWGMCAVNGLGFSVNQSTVYLRPEHY